MRVSGVGAALLLVMAVACGATSTPDEEVARTAAALSPGAGGTYSWTKVDAPTARLGPMMTFDRARQRTVVFGGYNATTTYSNETWEWDGTSYARVNVLASPLDRIRGGLVYQPDRYAALLFGG